MSERRGKTDSTGFEDLAEELDKWDETFDSLHMEMEAEEREAAKAAASAASESPIENVEDYPKFRDSPDAVTPTPGGFVGAAQESRASDAERADQFSLSVPIDPELDEDEVEISIVADDSAGFATESVLGVDVAIGQGDPFSDIGELEPFSGRDVFERPPLRSPFDSAAPRRGPAIVRRDELERRRLAESLGEQDDDDDDPAAEWDRPSITNVMAKATVDKMVETASAFFGDHQDDSVEIELDGDFYDDIEIDEVGTSDIPSIGVPIDVTDGPSRRRTMAHVVRRAPAKTTAPPQAVDGREPSDTAVDLAAAALEVGERIAPGAALAAAHRAIDELADDDSGLLPIEDRKASPRKEIAAGENAVLVTKDLAAAAISAAGARAGASTDPVRVSPSPLEALGFDLPPQLPMPRLAFKPSSSFADITLSLPENGEPVASDGDSRVLELSDAIDAVDLLDSGKHRGQFHRWAARLAIGLGDLDVALEHVKGARVDGALADASQLSRELLARASNWQALAESYAALESEAGAVLAGELNIALGKATEAAGADLSDLGDAGSILRAAVGLARAGDVAGLAVQTKNLAQLVADDELRVALAAFSIRAGDTDDPALLEIVGGDFVAWELAAGQPTAERAATALALAEALEQRREHLLACGFRIVAGALRLAVGDNESARSALSAAAERDAAHPVVCRTLLRLLPSSDAEIAGYLVAVVSGSAAAPLGARALWRWSKDAAPSVAAQLLRRAHALVPDDALILASLENSSPEPSEQDSERVTDVGLSLAPVIAGGLINSLNRARTAHQNGDPDARERSLAGIELPSDRLLVVAERLAHIGRGAELGAPPTGIAHEVLWRHRALASFGRSQPTAVADELTFAARSGDRLSARARLVGVDPLEAAASDQLWEASREWDPIGGRVELAQARVAALLHRTEEGVFLADDATAAVLATADGIGDRRLAWLLAVAAGRAGNWHAAAEHIQACAEGEFRSAYILLERGGDATAADERLATLLELHADREYVAELTSAARRKLGVIAPEATTMSETASRSVLEPFAAAIRAAEAKENTTEFSAAIVRYRRALEIHPDDPIALEGIAWACATHGDAAPISEVALEALRAAEERNDRGARADAYEMLARIDDEISRDSESAAVAWESAADADPCRLEPLRALERAALADNKPRALLVVYGRLLALTDSDVDRANVLSQRARIAEVTGRDPAEIDVDYQAILELAPEARMPLFFVEERARRQPASEKRSHLEAQIANVLAADPRSAAAFLCRSGETLGELGYFERAIGRFREAVTASPGHRPSLQAWRTAAWRGQLWLEFARACELSSERATGDEERASLHHLGGVALMDRGLDGEAAVKAFERAIACGFRGSDAFVRLRILFDERGDDERLGDLLRARLEDEDAPSSRLALHLELAGLCRNFWNDREGASKHLRAALDIEPHNRRAVADLSDISWELGAWDIAAETLLLRAKLEGDPPILKHIFYRLGTIYADHLPDPSWAIRSFKTVLSYEPDDEQALERLAMLSRQTGDAVTALSAYERLLRLEIPAERKVGHLHRVAEIQRERGQAPAAERAVRVAFDLAPGSRAALGVLLAFYRDVGDVSSIRVNLDRAAQVMRVRHSANPLDSEALAIVARVLAVRQRSGVPGSIGAARVAAELGLFIGGDESEELSEIAGTRSATRPRLEALARAEHDSLLAPAVIPAGLRHILRALRGRVGKFVGADPKRFGVGRGERQKRGKHPVATLASEMAAELGLRGAEIYISGVGLGAAIALQTEPVSVVLGSRFASLDRAAELTFALGRGLKLGQMGLAMVDSTTPDALDLFLSGLIRQFAPDYIGFGKSRVELDGEQHRLRRLIPSSMAEELRPHALALVGLDIEPGSLHTAMRRVGLRAGLIASTNAAGALAAGLRLAGHSSIQEAADDPDVLDFLRFALSEEHVLLQAALENEASNNS